VVKVSLRAYSLRHVINGDFVVLEGGIVVRFDVEINARVSKRIVLFVPRKEGSEICFDEGRGIPSLVKGFEAKAKDCEGGIIMTSEDAAQGGRPDFRKTLLRVKRFRIDEKALKQTLGSIAAKVSHIPCRA
jgi:hypothetical protein